MDSRRVIVAVTLTVATLFVWSRLFPPVIPEPIPVDSHSPGEVSERPPLEGAPPVDRQVEAAAGGTPDTAASSVSLEEVIEANGPQSIRISSDLYDITLSNVGGRVESWELRKFRRDVVLPGEESPPVELLSTGRSGRWRPLSVATGWGELDEQLAAARYRVTGASRFLGPGETQEIRFLWADGQGQRLEKVLTFHGDRYAVDVEVLAVLNRSPAWLVIGPGAAQPADRLDQRAYGGRAIVESGGEIIRRGEDAIELEEIAAASGGVWPPKDRSWLQSLEQAGQLVRHTGVSWAGVERTYFALLAVPESPWPSVLVAPVLEDGGGAHLAIAAPLGSSISRLSLYGGPKSATELRRVDSALERCIDYGFFESLAKVLFASLRFFHDFVGNWGVAIVLLTAVIKVLFLPLTFKQLATAQKMAKVAPKMKAIEAKYARAMADPKRRMDAQKEMNAERMKMYGDEGVNPLGGCLPMLFYLPVLYGFYALLQAAIELRHAPFVLWIQDLSAPDPFYVTPMLMVVSMVIQQAMTPSTADPAQRKIFMIMPFVLGFVFKDLASGLVLFWLTQNVLSIGQQFWMNRRSARLEFEEKLRRKGDRHKVGEKGVEAT